MLWLFHNYFSEGKSHTHIVVSISSVTLLKWHIRAFHWRSGWIYFCLVTLINKRFQTVYQGIWVGEHCFNTVITWHTCTNIHPHLYHRIVHAEVLSPQHCVLSCVLHLKANYWQVLWQYTAWVALRLCTGLENRAAVLAQLTRNISLQLFVFTCFTSYSKFSTYRPSVLLFVCFFHVSLLTNLGVSLCVLFQLVM